MQFVTANQYDYYWYPQAVATDGSTNIIEGQPFYIMYPTTHHPPHHQGNH